MPSRFRIRALDGLRPGARDGQGGGRKGDSVDLTLVTSGEETLDATRISADSSAGPAPAWSDEPTQVTVSLLERGRGPHSGAAAALDGETVPAESDDVANARAVLALVRDDDALLADDDAIEEDSPDEESADGLLGGPIRELVEAGLLPERRAVAFALRAHETGETFFNILVREVPASSLDPIYRRLAERLGRPLLEDKSRLVEQVLETEWLPLAAAEAAGVLLLRDEGQAGPQRYAALDPFDLVTRDWIARTAGRPATPLPVLPAAFFESIARLRSRTAEDRKKQDLFIPSEVKWQPQQLLRDGKLVDADVPMIVDWVLHRSFDQGASDIHFEPTEDGMLVRTRVDGILHQEERFPIALHPAVVARIKILAGLDVAEKRRPQDGRITALVRRSPLDLRISTLPTVLGEKVVMRLLDESALRPSPDKLGLREQNLRLMLDKISAPLGLILLSGPTGSGKTTTLYSCLSACDRLRRNVLTIEDPVEYRLKGVHQMQVNEKIGLSFANGLRTILRQDPDVVMVGECRDTETAKLAIQAALTGHVVFSTIHANDAVGVISRLLDMRIDPFLVSTAVSLAIAQRLLRTVCAHCKTEISGRDMLTLLQADGVSDERMAKAGLVIAPDQACLHAPGCSHCRHTGFSGRQAVFEMFELSEEMRQRILRERFDASDLRRLAAASGMVSMVDNAKELVAEGRTTYAELFRVFGDGV